MEISRELAAASSAPIVLAVLAEGERHGYALVRRVRDLSGGRTEWPDAMLYPVLHRLERQGRIEGWWQAGQGGRRRKYYRITERGRALRRTRSHREPPLSPR